MENIYKVTYLTNGIYDCYVAATNVVDAKVELLKIEPSANVRSIKVMTRNASQTAIKNYCVNR